MHPKISIIVPVYKVEKFLRKCIDSILCQTFTDFELIMVNDGSPDKCGVICDEYMGKDSRIKVIHKQNGGPSSARNLGINTARGEYIGFVDSDDFIHQKMYEVLYTQAQRHSSDLVICDVFKVDKGDFSKFNSINISSKSIQNYNKIQALYQLYLNSPGIFVYPVNKLYKRELFDEIRYEEGRIFEDEFIIHEIIYKCEKVTFIPCKLYVYVQRKNSIVNSKYTTKKFDKVYAHNDRVDFLKGVGENDLYHIALKNYMDYFLWNYFVAQKNLMNVDHQLRTLKKTFNNKLFSLIKNPLISKKQKIMLVLFCLKPSFYGLFIKGM